MTTPAPLPVHLRGERVQFVPIDPELHLDNYVLWLNDADVTRWLLRYLPMARGQERAWMDEATLGSATNVVWAIHDEEGRHIGGTGIHRIDWHARTGLTGIVLGDKTAWGKGYGKEVMRVRTKWAFEELGLHRLESECFVENKASAACLAAAGYQRIGIARQSRWRHGRWNDTILWDYLAPDYFARAEGEQT